MTSLPDGLHPIPNGLYCVPSALAALTGEPIEVVLLPAINRHDRNAALLENVEGVHLRAAETVLTELGYACRPYKKLDVRARLRSWAERSKRYPGRNLLVATTGGRRSPGHALVVRDGRVYDNHVPLGCDGAKHPFGSCLVSYVVLVEKRR